MEIFGSYMSDANRLPGEAVRICCLDTFVAFMSGMIIFPACFSFCLLYTSHHHSQLRLQRSDLGCGNRLAAV